MGRKDFPSDAMYANHIRFLYYFGGLTVLDIAKRLNESVSKIEWYLNRGF